MVFSGFGMKTLANTAAILLLPCEDAAEGAAPRPLMDNGKLGVWIADWKVILPQTGLPDEDFRESHTDLTSKIGKNGVSKLSRL